MKKVRDIKKADIKIDMTPMVDVIMLLLTFFMLTATFKIVESQAIEVSLPKSSGADTSHVPESKLITLTLTKAGDVFLDVDNPPVRKEVFGDEFGIGVYHPDTLSQSEFKTSGKILGQDFKRPIYFIPSKIEFEKKLLDIKKFGPKDEKGNSALKVTLKGDEDADYGVMEDLMVSLKETRNTIFHLLTQLKREKN
jgi:biopolymer transport protein ExbD